MSRKLPSYLWRSRHGVWYFRFIPKAVDCPNGTAAPKGISAPATMLSARRQAPSDGTKGEQISHYEIPIALPKLPARREFRRSLRTGDLKVAISRSFKWRFLIEEMVINHQEMRMNSPNPSDTESHNENELRLLVHIDWHEGAPVITRADVDPTKDPQAEVTSPGVRL